MQPSLHATYQVSEASRELTLDLRDVAAREGPVPLALSGLDPGSRAAAISSWRDRMASEYASARVFASLVPQAMAAGLEHGEVERLASMVTQEMDHARRCARVLGAFDEAPVARLPVLAEVPWHEDASPLEALLRNVISVSCCSETVAVALVGGEREAAGTPELAAELSRILADEVQHARFGWRLLERLGPGFDPRLRARLGAWLVSAFRHQLAFFAPFLSMDEASPAALAVGAPGGPTSFAVFVETMRTVTIPGLERHGLAAGKAWDLAVKSATLA